MDQGNETGLAHWFHKNWFLAAIFLVVLIGALAFLGARNATRAGTGSLSGSSAAGSSDSYAGIKTEVLRFYRLNYKDDSPGLTVAVQNYGCHMGVTVMKAGKALKSFAYFGPGQIFDLNE